MHRPDAAGLRGLRNLIRGTRAASLATVIDGQPHAALVTPACTASLSLLLLLSDLSQHTRQLRQHSSCAILCVEAAAGNPQTWRRVSLSCTARPDPDPTLRARYLAVHPYASPYAAFGDFAVWRLEPVQCHAVSGFAQASNLDAAALAVPAALAQEIALAAASIVAHCNADHADAMRDIGTWIAGQAAAWRLLDVDADGCDLGCEEASVRAAWTLPVGGAADVRTALIALIAAARERR